MLKRLIPFVKVAVGVALLAVVLPYVNADHFRDIGDRMGDFLFYFVAAVTLFFVAFSITIMRWSVLLTALSVPHKIRDIFRLGFIGLLFSQVIPGATGGDLVKGFYIARECPDRRVEAVVSVVLDRVIGLTGLMVLGSISFAINWDEVQKNPLLEKLVWVLGAAVVAVMVGGAMLSWRTFWQSRWVRAVFRYVPGKRLFAILARALWGMEGKRRLLLLSMAMSVVNHLTIVFIHVCLWRALFGEIPPIGTFFFLIPVGQLAMALPLTPGGLGVGEGVYEMMFLNQGFAEGHGTELALFLRFVVLLWASVGFYYYIRGKKELQEIVRQAEEQGIGEIDISPPEEVSTH